MPSATAQPLGFLTLLGGSVLLIAGVTGSTIPSVAQGHPDHAKAAGPTGGTAAPASSSSSSSVGTAVGHGPWRATQAAIAHEKGWSLADWNAVIALESGGNPASVNKSSGAFGLGQFLPSKRGEYPEAFSTNPILQIKAMARYIATRYGTPTAALAHEHAYGWY